MMIDTKTGLWPSTASENCLLYTLHCKSCMIAIVIDKVANPLKLSGLYHYGLFCPVPASEAPSNGFSAVGFSSHKNFRENLRGIQPW